MEEKCKEEWVCGENPKKHSKEIEYILKKDSTHGRKMADHKSGCKDHLLSEQCVKSKGVVPSAWTVICACCLFIIGIYFNSRISSLESDIMRIDDLESRLEVLMIKASETKEFSAKVKRSVNPIRHQHYSKDPLETLLPPQDRSRLSFRTTNEISSQGSPNSNRELNKYNVEFISPTAREEMKRNGGRMPKLDKTDGNAVPDGHGEKADDWLWLTSYSRIPEFNVGLERCGQCHVPAIQLFCSKTQEYCPPGEPGPEGPPGVKGDIGPPGHPGSRGYPGEKGSMGPPGPRGKQGAAGLSGTDGRDGLPGEPGLDGVPGRNGLDGIPGLDGLPGTDGRPGYPGRNGTDGRKGQRGLPGPQGKPGIPGPRGPVGPSGKDGTPGINGIQAYAVNHSDKHLLLIPPSIVGSQIEMLPLVVLEGENVRLRCSSTGSPRPVVTWRRKDGKSIPLGSWKSSSVEGPIMNLTRVNRLHMGEYECTADNGVTPFASRSFSIHVYFRPMIRIQNQRIGARLGSNIVLNCYVEAFPTPVNYWEKADGRLMESNEKYAIEIHETSLYKVHMRLNITGINNAEFGRYHCVSKNELGITKGDITIYRADSNKLTSATSSGKGVVIHGQAPPDLVELEELCPPQPPCKECPERIEKAELCRSGGFALLDMVGWEIHPLGNLTLPLPSNRTQDCVLSAVGKPVFNRDSSSKEVGCWMRDPVPSLRFKYKYWLTNDSLRLYEYPNKTDFTRDRASRIYTLPFETKGHFHAVYNGSFFYVTDSMDGHAKIVRFDLTTGTSNGDLLLPYASTAGKKLYSTRHSWVDLATDENGLWAIHGVDKSNNTAIVKIQVDPKNMKIIYGWNITVSHIYAGDMFIVCGVLYAVDSTEDRETKIRLALDLYHRNLLKVDDLIFTNPFRNTKMVSYNPRTRELLTWDDGNQLIYPIKYTDIGYKSRDQRRNPSYTENNIYAVPKKEKGMA